MSELRMNGNWAGRADKTKRPPMAPWLSKYSAKMLALLPSNSPLRRSHKYHTKIYWATPPWLTEEMRKEIAEIYKTCPPGGNVDHIVPIDSPIVCGLHVPWNMQHLSFIDNMRKSNKWWPDHPFDNQALFSEELEPHQLRLNI